MTNKSQLNQLPRERMSRRAFQSLHEYSCSTPTGVTPGKVWRHDLRAFDKSATGQPKLWVIREYARDGEGFVILNRVPVVAEPNGSTWEAEEPLTVNAPVS